MSKDKQETDPLDDFRNWVQELFQEELDPRLVFHNWALSKELEGAVMKLADTEYGIEQPELTALRVAALAYPLGATRIDLKALEKRFEELDDGQEQLALLRDQMIEHSKALLTAYLEENPDLGASMNDLDAVQLLSSIQDGQTSGLLSDIFWDVVHNWYGRNRYGRRSDVLALQMQALPGSRFDALRFENYLMQDLLEFKYRSPHGSAVYEEKRLENLRDQRKSLLKTEKDYTRRKTGKDLGRGIDTLYRTAFRNHINLSRIADGKANMMISINTIILSIILAVSGAGIGFFQDLFFKNPLALLPIVSLLLSSLTAVVFAVFSARPKVTEYRITKKRLKKSDEASLLYFGNFLKLDKADFIKYMDRMKYDQHELYRDLTRDLYDLGQVLHRKYLLLTISYNTFVGGLALSVLLFMGVYLIKII